MAESGEVRLVRCPKCENLLPELPDYSVYQCGGCGAVLRAKKGDLDGVRVSSDDARLGVLSEKSDNFTGKPENSPAKPAVTLLRTRQGEVGDSDRRISKAVAERLGSDSNETAENWGVENGEMGELDNGRLKSSDIHQSKIAGIKQKVPERGEMDGFGRLGKGGDSDNGGGRFQPESHVGEGTSRSYANGYLRRTAAARNPVESNECAEPGRAELLRRLEELKQQLSQSCDVNGKPEAKPPLGSRMFGRPESYADPDGWLYDHPSWYQREPESRSRYCNYYQEPLSAMDRYENYPLSALDLSRVSGCENSFGPPMARRLLPHRKPGCFLNTRSHPYLPGHYPCPEPTPFERDQVDNQFPCSCYHCYLKQSQMPASAYRRYPLAPNNPLPHHPENHRAFAPHGGYNSRISHLHLHVSPCDLHPPLRNRWPNDVKLESRGVAFSRPQRMSLASGGRPCQPIAGGSPFITCHNCLELLELPKKVSQLDKSNLKICCGGCSSVISFTLVDQKLFPVELPAKKNVVDDLDSSDEVMHAKPYDPCSGMRQDNAGFHSEERDNTNYDVHTMDKELVSSFTAQGCNLTKSEEVQNLQLSSSSTSEDGDNNGNLVVTHGVKSDRQSPVKTVLSPSAPGSPLQERFDYSSLKYRAVNRCPKGSLSSRSDQERVVSGKTCLRQNSLQESMATEMEVCANDCSNAVVSQDNGNIYKEVEQPKCKKGVDSFLAGIIKKSFRDFSKSNHSGENRKRNVTVNGHLIPDRSVKKAEKLAGPVSPGHYWYDHRAGFWGVMGGPGLGIIPPHIEEFNYPMPDKCAGGNTDIFVNGRELHQKDLDLLAGRGLPATRYRSYIVEISGRVVDEDSNEELDGLGKLAPTIEKVKHGFGMRDPKDSAKLT